MEARKHLEETYVSHRIGVIGGDGIGPEVVAEALKVVRY
jgi:isocitrate/isopropylmalate dehydrogenase